MTKANNNHEAKGEGRSNLHGPFKCQDCGESRNKSEFSQRQLHLPVKQHMSCRHCNEAEKFERKEERRKSLEMGKQFAEVKSGEIHNKGRATHQNFVSHSNVA